MQAHMQAQDESTDPTLRELIYRRGTVIRLSEQNSDWVWDVFIRVQVGDEACLGIPVEVGELHPLLVMDNLGRGASPFLVASMCAQACAAGATVTTKSDSLFDELKTRISDVLSNGVADGGITYRLDKKLTRKLKITPPGGVEAPATPPERHASKELGTQPLPAELPQHTFPEAKVAAIALADGPRMRRWIPVEGEIALRHHVSDREPLQTKLVGAPLLDWLGMPNTLERLQEELRQLGLPAVLLLHICLGAALESATDQRLFVRHSIDEMIRAIGWQPRSRVERAQARHKIWRWMAVFSALQVIGKRAGRYKDPDTGEVYDLTSRSELLHISERLDAEQLSFDPGQPPVAITYNAGPWIQHWAGNRRVLSYFGDVRKLAAIPAGKPSGAWAQAIGMALQQWWREQSATAVPGVVGDDNHLTVRFVHKPTRRQLLDMFPPTPTVDEILNSRDPGRAKTYWRDAIALLKQAGMIAHYREIGTTIQKRQGWAREWLDQELDVRPDEEGKAAVAEIAERAQRVRRARRSARTVRAETS
jgi:hypothetical protein